MLKERLDITPEKADGGTLKIDLPDVAKNPVLDAVYLRFANDYLYVGPFRGRPRPEGADRAEGLLRRRTTARSRRSSSASTASRPMSRRSSSASSNWRSTRSARRRRQRERRGEGVHRLGRRMPRRAASRRCSTTAKELEVRVLIDEKADEMSAEVVLTRKTGTAMAKNIASLGKQDEPPGRDRVGARTRWVAARSKIALTDGTEEGASAR